MELRQLEVFMAVIEEASVTKAAARLNLSPGAVSLQLHNLAAGLRTDLFVRSGKRLAPTPAALRLFEHSKRLLALAREIELDFENDPASDERPFVFATGATTLIHKLGRPLRALRKQFPSMAMSIQVAPSEQMVDGLLSRQIDLALISLPFDAEGVEMTPLYDEELLIVSPSTERLRGWHVGSIEPAELGAARFMLYPRHSNMRAIIEGFFREIGIAPPVIMEADDTEAIKRLVESGFGYSVLPEFALRQQPRFYRLFRVPGRRLLRRQALATPKTDHPRALTLAVARFLRNQLEA